MKTVYPAASHRLFAKIQFAKMYSCLYLDQTLHPRYYSCRGFESSAQKQYASFHTLYSKGQLNMRPSESSHFLLSSLTFSISKSMLYRVL